MVTGVDKVGRTLGRTPAAGEDPNWLGHAKIRLGLGDGPGFQMHHGRQPGNG